MIYIAIYCHLGHAPLVSLIARNDKPADSFITTIILIIKVFTVGQTVQRVTRVTARLSFQNILIFFYLSFTPLSTFSSI